MTNCKASQHVLILMVGLPRSGKTTAARAFGHPIVSPDEIRTALHGRPFAREAEPMVWAIARIMVRALFRAGHQTVILDGCNNTRARRDEWRDEFNVEVCYFPTPADECIRRAHESGREDIVPVIERMAKYHEPPSDDEPRASTAEWGRA